jgi:6-phospho-beta-glucosidase
MSTVRVVVLGGSGVATPELAKAISDIPGRTLRIELVLVGRDQEKLELVTNASRLMAAGAPPLEITSSVDAEASLEGAHYVINQVRVGGLEARVEDESFPRELGIPGEETMGAGGFANALRTVPVSLQYARLIERIAPQATLLTFANPASLVQYAIADHTRVRTIGMCDSPLTLIATIAKALGAPVDQLAVNYAGMHHFGWVTGVYWRGRNVMPDALARAGDICPDIEPAIVRAIGAIPSPYFRYVFHPDRMLARQLGRRTRAEDLIALQDEILADYRSCLLSGRQPASLAKRGAVWYSMIIAPLLVALIEGSRAKPFILNVTNGQTIPWLPATAVIEVNVLVDGGQARALACPPLPLDAQALVQKNCSYEMLAAEAIVEHNRPLALRALLLNPMIHTYDQAAAVLDRVWP